MNRLIRYSSVSLIFFIGLFQAANALNPTADVNWKTMTIDMGNVPFEQPVVAEFSLSNKGMIPLIITDVKPSCGCTIADYPKKPIVAGQEAIISVTYDAKTPGYFSKTIDVYANVEGGLAKLYIKGTVVK